MDPNKTYQLIIQPIVEITDDDMRRSVLATNGSYWFNGQVRRNDGKYVCYNEELGWIVNVTHFAILPKY